MPRTGLPDDLRSLAAEIHGDNIVAGWWKQNVERDEGGCTLAVTTLPRNVGELLALIHSEISEADHGYELGLMDDKLPDRLMVEVELADVAIRVLDMLGYYATFWPQNSKGAPLPLPVDAYWPDWCRMMHRQTTRALEAFRKGDPAKGCSSLDALLGIIHFAAIRFGYDVAGAIVEKREFNRNRADHKLEIRQQAGGKAF